jgi:hypothetical protein
MSLFDKSKQKDKKKGGAPASKGGSTFIKGKTQTNSKPAAKNTRLTGGTQRGS